MQANNKIMGLIGLLIVLVVTAALAPTLFSTNLTGSGAPAWLVTLWPVLIAIAILVLIVAVALGKK